MENKKSYEKTSPTSWWPIYPTALSRMPISFIIQYFPVYLVLDLIPLLFRDRPQQCWGVQAVEHASTVGHWPVDLREEFLHPHVIWSDQPIGDGLQLCRHGDERAEKEKREVCQFLLFSIGCQVTWVSLLLLQQTCRINSRVIQGRFPHHIICNHFSLFWNMLFISSFYLSKAFLLIILSVIFFF